jgi:DMSO/TMAO reductase YedYZ molybdopterin-dependent catalytic subunit
VVPSLYGWKSAKWVSRLEFRSTYKDGYWEALGYHERGAPALEERFKT